LLKFIAEICSNQDLAKQKKGVYLADSHVRNVDIECFLCAGHDCLLALLVLVGVAPVSVQKTSNQAMLATLF